MKRTLILLSIFLCSCRDTPPKSTPFPTTGIEVPAPAGYVDFCKRNPTDDLCRKPLP